MHEDPSPILPWNNLEREELLHCRVFTVDRVLNQSPTSGRKDDFFVLGSADWVNVIALTPDEKVVLVEQYRHGTDRVTLEIPGGLVDPVDAGPLEAGPRELLEETGYRGESAEQIGTVEPNPSIQSNRCSTLLIRNAVRVAEPSLDPNEEMRTTLRSLGEIGTLIRTGDIRHALVVAAFYHLANHLGTEVWDRLFTNGSA